MSQQKIRVRVRASGHLEIHKNATCLNLLTNKFGTSHQNVRLWLKGEGGVAIFHSMMRMNLLSMDIMGKVRTHAYVAAILAVII